MADEHVPDPLLILRDAVQVMTLNPEKSLKGMFHSISMILTAIGLDFGIDFEAEPTSMGKQMEVIASLQVMPKEIVQHAIIIVQHKNSLVHYQMDFDSQEGIAAIRKSVHILIQWYLTDYEHGARMTQKKAGSLLQSIWSISNEQNNYRENQKN